MASENECISRVVARYFIEFRRLFFQPRSRENHSKPSLPQSRPPARTRVDEPFHRNDATTTTTTTTTTEQSTGGYFRAHARNEAHFNRKLCGALKELGQGQTEIIVEGKTSAIRSFLRWCKKGPGELSSRCCFPPQVFAFCFGGGGRRTMAPPPGEEP